MVIVIPLIALCALRPALLAALLALGGCSSLESRHLDPAYLQEEFERLKLFREIRYGERQA